MQKWRVYEFGRLKVAVNEKRSIHTCTSRDPKRPATAIVAVYDVVYWDGREKLCRLKGLER